MSGVPRQFQAAERIRAMKGDVKVVEYLNKALRHELTAVNQYWLHYRLLDNWGYKDLAKQWRGNKCNNCRNYKVYLPAGKDICGLKRAENNCKKKRERKNKLPDNIVLNRREVKKHILIWQVSYKYLNQAPLCFPLR